MDITAAERNTLRELAKKQAELAALPIMATREALWYDLNDGKVNHPLVTMEFHGVESEIYPPLTCENPLARALESQMAGQIFKHENFKDDRLIPAYVSVFAENWFRPFAYEPNVYKPETEKNGIGHMFTHVVEDLEKDFGIFKPSIFEVDAGMKKGKEAKAQAEEILGDILPVKLVGAPLWYCPAYELIGMMSMETLFLSLYDYPDLFHQIMRQLTDSYHSYINALEENNALLPTNDGTPIPMDTYCYSRELPKEPNKPVKMTNLWGYTNFQETVNISTSMFDEFFFSYTLEIANRCGLYSYGCCEPVHDLWEPCLSRMKNLRKVSISPWCDEEYIGDAIRGKKIVYHRKPSPNFISVDNVFDEEAFLKHMERSVKAARGCPLEVTFRDICTVRGEPQRMARAVELTREAFQRWWQN